MPVVLMAIFNASDFIGKVLASIPYEWSRTQLVSFSALRFLLIPPLVLCAAPRSDPLLSWEGWPMLFSLLLGLSNGLVGSLPMILAPNKVADQNRELCGNVMTISYSLGLTTGSLLAYGLDALLGPPVYSTCGTLNITDLCLTDGCQPLLLAGNGTRLLG
ncbi:equilibrative nucleoside transporter 4-like [Amphibalanus amphitrite]|uniref:equilibrative nucleoside transporter 4-like n=1 Tax=Amphibalanus amphitrite TaxID=1232801 RepID=UPI001C929ECF|nr:equilibrative nucleoside transporter 4-like [Amphibalanus amphitrite]